MKRKAELVPVDAPDSTPKHNPLVLPDWKVTQIFLADATDTEPRRYVINAEYLIRPEACIYCGVVGRLHLNSPKGARVRYADAPLHGRPVSIAVLFQSYECQDCGQSFKQPLPHMEPGRFMTQRCADIIAEWTVMWTMAEIARQVNLDEAVVRAIKNEEDEAFDIDYQPYAPIAFGIDELTLGGERRLILTDIGSRCVLDIREDMEGSTLASWLSKRPDRDRIRLVVSDMHVGYHNVVGAMLPDALLIMDKWHVQKGVLEHLDTIRNRGLKAEAKAKEAAAEAAKAAGLTKAKTRKPRLRKGEPARKEQNPWKAKRLLAKHFEDIKSQKTLLALDGILKNYPLIRDAHETKERFYAIWKAEDRADAEARFEAWASSIPISVPEFETLAATIRTLHEPVFAYFDHRYTAGYTECANGLIKILNRNGRGYRMATIRRKAIMMPRRDPTRPGVCERCLKPIADLRVESSFLVLDSILDPGRDFIVCQPCCDEVYEQLDAEGDLTPFEHPDLDAWMAENHHPVELSDDEETIVYSG